MSSGVCVCVACVYVGGGVGGGGGQRGVHLVTPYSGGLYLTTLFLRSLSPLSGYPVLVHILSPETDNCSSLIRRRVRMTAENTS